MPLRNLHRICNYLRTPEPGALELATSIVAMALLLLYGALALGKEVNRLSLAKAIRAIRKAMQALRHGAFCATLLHALRDAVTDRYKRHSSKRARDWPHKKNERPSSPPELRRLLARQKTRIQGLWMTYQEALLNGVAWRPWRWHPAMIGASIARGAGAQVHVLRSALKDQKTIRI